MMAEAALVLGIGAIAGFVGPLLGMGGGIVMIPLLSLVAGFSTQTAMGLASVGIIASSLAANRNNLNQGILDPLSATFYGIPAVLAGFLGGLVGLSFGEVWLKLAFSLILLLILLFLLLQRYLPALRQQQKTSQSGGKRPLLALLVVFLAALLGSMVGISGGSIIVPLLYLLSPLSWKQAVASSSMVLAYAAFPASLLRMFAGYVPIALLITLILGIQLGARVCRPLQRIIPSDISRILFILVVSSAALSTLLSSLEKLL